MGQGRARPPWQGARSHALVQAQASGTLDTIGSCYSRCLLYQLLQGSDPRNRKWKLREVKAFALQNSLLERTRSTVTDGDNADGRGALVKSMDPRATPLAGCMAFGPLHLSGPQFLNL